LFKSGFQPTTNSATREAEELDPVAAAKKELADEHEIRVAPAPHRMTVADIA